MKIKLLTIEDKPQLEDLISSIEDNLEKPDYWLPINSTSKEHFFDPEWTIFLGMFDCEKLIAAVALFLNEHEFGESLEHLDGASGKVAEFGRAMVHPDYRGNNYLYALNLRLMEVAEEHNIDLAIATIHPDNTPSQKSFKKIGFERKLTYVKENGFLRDIYVFEFPKKA